MNQSLAERSHKHIWQPFTQMALVDEPIPMVSGNGATLTDIDGNVWIDGISSWWTCSHGHAHPHIAKRVSEQIHTLEHVIFAGFTHKPAIELAERLLPVLPGEMKRMFFSDNGSTAVEVGMKMCFQYWFNIDQKRTTLLAFHDSYHGDTFGAMSAADRSAFSEPFHPFLFDVTFLPYPICEKTLNEGLKIINEIKSPIAGIIYEPLIQGAGGMKMCKPQQLDTILQHVKQLGGICIADEVMVGFGRTETLFASDQLEVKPDIICLSKGLTGGTMALGATCCAQFIYDAFLSQDKLKTFFHGHSFTGNPVACSAACASLDLLLDPETLQKRTHIMNMHNAFQSKLKSYPIAKNIRQSGTIIAFEVGDGASYFATLRDQIWEHFKSRHIILRPLGNTIYILPPFCITDQQLETIYSAILEFLESL